MDFLLQELADCSVSFAQDRGAQYCDVRAETQCRKSALVENGQIEHIIEKVTQGIGIRLINNGAWGFCSITNPKSIEQVKEKIEKALRSSNYSSKNKKKKIELYPISTSSAKKEFPVSKKPDIENMIDVGLECNRIILENPKVTRTSVNSWFSENSKYFKSSEGTKILQNFTDTVIEMTATAHESGLTQSVNITEGGRGGMEQITNNDIGHNSAKDISKKASELLYAKPIKEDKGVVIMNPDFVALLTHEILGHPSEADRVLGKEMAWAGGAWWKGKIGEKIGSEKLNVFDDPTISQSLGWYDYDDEGVKTEKTNLVENGILKNHMQNRETAQIFGESPTGNMRATSYTFMPLIRMACTCIQKGDWKQEEMIKEVKNGYMISNMKIPSIDMKRYNWSISCQYAQKIESGELTDMLRDVIVMGTAPEFFNSIDACGDDFKVRPITNCGKGDPMQSMIMGNGGPSIRGIATIKSVN